MRSAVDLRCARSVSTWRRRGSKRSGHRTRHFVLHVENVCDRAVEAVRPDVTSALGLDELRGDTHAFAGPTHAALYNVANTELAPDVAARPPRGPCR